MTSITKENHRETSPRKVSGPKVARPSWQIQTAKARFSEVFRRARSEGPQLIARQGKEGDVMISDEQYDELVSRSRQPKSIVQFFRESPLVGVELSTIHGLLAATPFRYNLTVVSRNVSDFANVQVEVLNPWKA